MHLVGMRMIQFLLWIKFLVLSAFIIWFVHLCCSSKQFCSVNSKETRVFFFFSSLIVDFDFFVGKIIKLPIVIISCLVGNISEPIYENVPLPWPHSAESGVAAAEGRSRASSIQSAPEINNVNLNNSNNANHPADKKISSVTIIEETKPMSNVHVDVNKNTFPSPSSTSSSVSRKTTETHSGNTSIGNSFWFNSESMLCTVDNPIHSLLSPAAITFNSKAPIFQNNSFKKSQTEESQYSHSKLMGQKNENLSLQHYVKEHYFPNYDPHG